MARRKRKDVDGVIIIDCADCGEPLSVHDTSGELRGAPLLRFIRFWRRLSPEKQYTVDSIARALKTNQDVVSRYIRRFYGFSLNGKPVPRKVLGVKVNQQTGRDCVKHSTVIKDMDPEEGLSWPLEVRFLSVAEVCSSEPVVGQDVALKVEVEYCFTVPTRVGVGIPSSNGLWLTWATDVLVGNGARIYALAFRAPREPQEMRLEVQALHQRDDVTWELADQLALDLSVKERRVDPGSILAVAALVSVPVGVMVLAWLLSRER